MTSDIGQFGPWEVEGYEVRVDCAEGVRLAVSRSGRRLKGVPPALRECADFAWIRLALDAAIQHRRQLRALLENAMSEQIPLSAEDLALLALDPVGRPMLEGLLVEQDGLVGNPLPQDWLLETLAGDLVRLGAPVRVAHPARLHRAGTLEAWGRWLNTRPVRQPFKQIRREVYLPNADERSSGTFSDRFAGEVVRWDQARALLEGRGWHRVTKTGAERGYRSARLAAHVEFRNPLGREYTKEQVILNRIYFLPRGEQVVNRANPGVPVGRVPAVVFSETLRDVGLVARVAGRNT